MADPVSFELYHDPNLCNFGQCTNYVPRWGCLVYKCVDHSQVTGCDDTRPCPADQEYECVK